MHGLIILAGFVAFVLTPCVASSFERTKDENDQDASLRLTPRR